LIALGTMPLRNTMFLLAGTSTELRMGRPGESPLRVTTLAGSAAMALPATIAHSAAAERMNFFDMSGTP